MAMLGVTLIKNKLKAKETMAASLSKAASSSRDEKETQKFCSSHGNLLQNIFDPKCKTEYSNSSLLSFDELITTEPMDTAQNGVREPDKGLFRFTTDQRAKAVDISEMLVAAGSLTVFPLTFLHGGSWAEPEYLPGGRGILVADAVLDLLYLFTMILDFNVTYLHRRKGYEVVTRRRIRKHIFSNPLFWVSLVSCTCPIWIGCGLTTLINNLKLFRVRHVLEMPDSLWFYRDKVWARLAKPVFLLVVASHWLACLLSYFGGFREALTKNPESEFETRFGDTQINGRFSLYLTALVEGVYLMTGGLDNPVGDGGIRDKQFGALIMVCIFGPVGCVVASLLTATLTSEIAMAYALQAKHEENKAFMSHGLRILNIPKNLRQRVMSQYYFQKMGHDVEAFDALFNKKNLSSALENALLVYLYKDTVISSKLFEDRDYNYILEVLRILRFEVFLPGDYVARKGEIANTMYFVIKGKLKVLTLPPDCKTNTNDVRHAKEMGSIYEKANFGEIALINRSVRTAWVRADTYSVLSALERDKIWPIWEHFPEERKKIEYQVQATLEKDRKRIRMNKMNKGVKKALGLARFADHKHGVQLDGEVESNAADSHDDLGDAVGRHQTEMPLDDEINPDAAKILPPLDVQTTLRSLMERQTNVERVLHRILKAVDPDAEIDPPASATALPTAPAVSAGDAAAGGGEGGAAKGVASSQVQVEVHDKGSEIGKSSTKSRTWTKKKKEGSASNTPAAPRLKPAERSKDLGEDRSRQSSTNTPPSSSPSQGEKQ